MINVECLRLPKLSGRDCVDVLCGSAYSVHLDCFISRFLSLSMKTANYGLTENVLSKVTFEQMS